MNALVNRLSRNKRLDCSAAIQATNIKEVLELILLYLPIQDILLAQRVSKRFKSAIEGSEELQRTPFFLPEPPSEDYTQLNPRINPLYDGTTPLWDKPFLFVETGFERVSCAWKKCPRGIQVLPHLLYEPIGEESPLEMDTLVCWPVFTA